MRSPQRSFLVAATTALALAACVDPAIDSTPDAAEPDEDTADASTASTLAPPSALVPGEMIVKLKGAAEVGVPIEIGGEWLIPMAQFHAGSWLMRLDETRSAQRNIALDDLTIDTVQRLRDDPAVEYADENPVMELSLAPSDPLFVYQQWHYDQIRLQEAWNITTGSPAVRIAVIDTGKTPHPDIVWGAGWDFSANDSDPTNPNTYHHGTFVAGLIGATSNLGAMNVNNRGVAGICWNCPLLPLRANLGNGISLGAATLALEWAAGRIDATTVGPRRADVANFSFNSATRACTDTSGGVPELRTAINLARTQGVVLVAAAGNFGETGGTHGPAFPADCNNVIAAAASQGDGQLAPYSNNGPGIDLTAPGGGYNNATDPHFGVDVGDPPCQHIGNELYEGTSGVVSTWSIGLPGTLPPDPLQPGRHCYRYSSGTSYASPHVSGVAGLMLAARPGLTPVQVEQTLRLTTQPPSPFFGWGFICPTPNSCGTGLLDAKEAVDAINDGTPPIANMAPSYIDFGTVSPAAPSTQTFALGNVGFSTLNVTSANPMQINGGSWFSFAFASGACTSGQSCSRTLTVPVGGTANIPVRCTPSGAGTQTAELVVPSNSVGQVRVPLWCTSAGVPVLAVTPGSVAFGDVLVGTAGFRTVTLSNTGTAPLSVTGLTTSGPPFAVTNGGGLPGTIAVGANVVVTLSCTPPAMSNYNGTLTISSNSSGGTAIVPLSCRGVAPILTVSPNPVGFGDVQVGTTAFRAVTVSNTGTAPLSVTALSTSGAPFAITNGGGLPGTIAVGASTLLTLSCAPPATLVYSGALAISSNGGSANVALTCHGVAPLLVVTPSPVDFGNVLVGTTAYRTVTVVNSGGAPLTVTGLTTSGPPFVMAGGGGLPGVIPVNGGTEVTISCTPTAMLNYSGTLTVTSNGGTAIVPLACRGVAPVLTATPSALAFGDQRVGDKAFLVETVVNAGTAPLTISAANVTGAAFARVSALPGVIAVGGIATITIRCSPPDTLYYSGTLAITSDGGSANIPLTCHGVAPQIAVNTTTLAFPDVLLGSTSNQTLWVTNTGTAPLLLSSGGITSKPFGISTAFPLSIPPGATSALALHCSPSPTSTPGWKEATLTLIHDAQSSPTTIALTCYVAAGAIEVVEPIGEMNLVPYEPQQATIRNIGVGPLLIDYLAFSDEGFSVSVPPVLPVVLAPGETLSWWVSCEEPIWPWSTISAKQFAKHDGINGNASLFAVSCTPTFYPPYEPPIE